MKPWYGRRSSDPLLIPETSADPYIVSQYSTRTAQEVLQGTSVSIVVRRFGYAGADSENLEQTYFERAMVLSGSGNLKAAIINRGTPQW